jgi:hypothetical protein
LGIHFEGGAAATIPLHGLFVHIAQGLEISKPVSEPLFCTIQENRCLKLRAAGFGRNGFRPAGLGAAAEFNRRENPAGRGNRYLRRRAEKKDPYPIVSILK